MKWLSPLMSVALIASTICAGRSFADPTTNQVQQLIATFDDADLRYGASVALTKVGKIAVADLTAALDSEEPDIRVWSAYTLGEIGPSAESAVEELARTCIDKDDAVRAAAVESLGKIGVASKTAVDALSIALTDDDGRVRICAAISLGKIGPQAHAAVDELIAALSDSHARDAARSALTRMGPNIADQLLGVLDNDDIRFDVTSILRNIDPQKTKQAGLQQPTAVDLPSLGLVLFDSTRSDSDRTAAATALASLNEDGMRYLITAFENPRLARTAATTFSNTGPIAVPLLVEALGHEQPTVRSKACNALGYIGADAADARKKLIELLTDDDRDVRYHAVRALHEFGKKAAPAVPSLVDLVMKTSEPEATRQWAIKTLIVTLPETHEAVVKGLLAASQETNNYGVSQLAKQQLLKIDPASAKEAGIK